ncbi:MULTISPECIES: hypothetical protein [Mycobacteriaceae]|jgi:hypothetical protein|uniref:Uncharacterized protein n=4 Tax=Mycobacteriaceae TaxID=1762 RepID=A0ABR5FQH3_9MYCO|nr:MULTISPECIES: hypothetical protein [Mycobacteriaceae]KLI07148.1 hypothetical protein AA982_16700 [Mycolicibacterium senegalense]KLO50170.1 hypothetical protein ABW05_00170 [Mycolicibacterium senegalense]MBP2452023.1 hypothetical protein [Mycolicibacterium lutetiense]OHT93445.1 hypothetical protein BKG61_21010 [Mycobacterium syngnathidarum]OLT96288.1 hypothetical protein BKG60_12875 [Mycobacterium syngnathidarum]
MSIIDGGVEKTLTYDEAAAILAEPGYDAYGRLRLYGVIADGESAGQLTAIKSQQNLDRFSYTHICSVER